MPRSNNLLLLTILLSCGLTAQTTDAQGRKQGYWKKKDEKTGKLIYEGEFKDDKPVGTFKYYYPNDSVRAVMTFRSGGPASYAQLFHKTGKRMAEGKYLGEDLKDSIWTYYDEDGVLLSREEYINGKKEGKSYVYMPDGAVSEEKEFSNNTEDGKFVQYFDNKRIKSKGTYKAGKLDGRVVYLYPNGVEAAAGFYRNGLKNGPWIYREEDGKVTEKELYKNGALASEEETKAFFEKNKTGGASASPTPSKNKKGAKQQ